MHDFGCCADHGIIADATKLVETYAPAYVDVIANFDVTAKGGMTTHHELITDSAFVGDVAIGENEIVIPNDGLSAFCSGTVHGGEFAEDVTAADAEPRTAALELEIVRLTPDIGVGVNFIIIAYSSDAVDSGVVHDLGAFSDFDAGPDVGVSANGDASF